MAVEREKRTIVDYFKGLEDLRIERSKRHSLLDIITIAGFAHKVPRLSSYMCNRRSCT